MVTRHQNRTSTASSTIRLQPSPSTAGIRNSSSLSTVHRQPTPIRRHRQYTPMKRHPTPQADSERTTVADLDTAATQPSPACSIEGNPIHLARSDRLLVASLISDPAIYLDRQRRTARHRRAWLIRNVIADRRRTIVLTATS